jgi:alanine racemase
VSAQPLSYAVPGDPRPELIVDLAAIAANTRVFAGRIPGDLMAVVKADGFGHGAVDVARTALAHGATWLGVTSIDEALPLRAAGLTAPMLSWLNPVDAEFGAAVAAGVDLAVPGVEHLVALPPGARVHLQLDSGLAREGAPPALWPALCRAARRLELAGRIRVVGVMGHLPCADDPAHPSNAAGRLRFAWAVQVARAAGLRPAHRHLAATAATLNDPLAHHTMSRVGAGLVGIGAGLRPALTLTAPIVTCRRVPAGTAVGYGHTWSTGRPTHLGLLPLGYADGLPRAASDQASVSVRGLRRPLAGRISMDQAVVDLGPDPVTPGETATVFGGDGPSVAEWAAWAGTIEHEIVTGLGPRVPRRVTTGLRAIR